MRRVQNLDVDKEQTSKVQIQLDIGRWFVLHEITQMTNCREIIFEEFSFLSKLMSRTLPTFLQNL